MKKRHQHLPPESQMKVRKIASKFADRWPTVNGFVHFMLEDAEDDDLEKVMPFFDELFPIPLEFVQNLLKENGVEPTPEQVRKQQFAFLLAILDTYRDDMKCTCPGAKPVQ